MMVTTTVSESGLLIKLHETHPYSHVMLAETLAALATARSNAGPLTRAIAPYTSSNDFKLEHSNEKRPFAKGWGDYFSSEGKSRFKSTLKAASRVDSPDSVISLATARPAARYYPWQSISICTTDIEHCGSEERMSATNVSCEKGEAGYDLGLVLNYGYAAGSPQLLRFITEHVEIVHHPPYRDWESAVTCGTTSAIDIVFRMLCDHGDSVLCEYLTYPNTIEAAKCLGVKMMGVKMDEGGLLPNDLDQMMCNWDVKLDGPRPRLLYTIPTGQNPTGTTQSAERRRTIYRLAEKHDLLIVEDDPYFLIQLQHSGTSIGPELDPSITAVSGSTSPPQVDASNRLTSFGDRYIATLPPSFLSLDTSGRVLRLDSTSKILAPGLRCGWITGCSELIQKFINQTELSTLSPSGPSQALLYKLLDETWGHAGFFNWLGHLSAQYRQTLQALLSACEQSLPKELCTWATPSAGMFLCIRVDLSQHPTALRSEGLSRHDWILQVEKAIHLTARDQGVLVNRGSWFSTRPQASDEIFIRLTFVTVVEDQLREAIARLGCAIRKVYQVG